MIVIFSQRNEYSTSQVVKILNEQNEFVVRINGDDGRFKLHHIDSTGVYAYDHLHDQILNLCNAKSCWYRRNGITKDFLGLDYGKILHKNIFDGITDDDYLSGFIRQEGDSLIDLIYTRIESAAPRKLGSYFKRDLNRLILFELAKSFGFQIPDYSIITKESQVDQLYDVNMNIVTKAVSNGVYRNVKNRRFYTYTERVNREDLMIEDPVEIFPTLIMNEIEKSFEIRAFFLNGVFYSMAIFSQKDDQTQVDFRKYNKSKPNRTEPFLLPKEVEVKLKKLFDHLQLNTGSADLIIDKNGDYVFLEINPIGQFGMVTNPCNYNIDYKIAKYLSYEGA